MDTATPEASRPGLDAADSIVLTLQNRVRNFEAGLATAMAHERDFQSKLEIFSASLNTFVSKHREEDQNLTRLIEEDTQRSKEARDEYDVLASRFDDTYRPNNPTKTREFLKNVSFYITVALSLVFIAPLHAIYSMFLKLLTRVGLMWYPVGYVRHASYGAPRTRQRPKKSPKQGVKHSILRIDTRQRRKPKIGKTCQLNEKGLGDKNLVSNLTQANVPTVQYDEVPLTVTSDTIEEKTSFSEPSHVAKVARDNVQAEHQANASDSDDDFMDAKDGTSLEDTSPDDDIDDLDEDEDSGLSDRQDKRPAWARPFDSRGLSSQLSTFPSMDFWDISDDEMNTTLVQSHKTDANS